ncbi:hypothetical protein RHIZ404_200064 [Rhizobium sp. EC-SD404]|nr:hypothetical protein RHIZ404_200064 [Rhizobium sp. EC-SD404]
MELAVDQSGELGRALRLQELLVQPFQIGDFRLCRVLRGKAGHKALHLLTHGVELEDLLHGQDRDGDTATGSGFEQALFLETAERFAHRRTADPDPHRDFFFAQRVAGLVMPVADRRQNGSISVLAARLAQIFSSVLYHRAFVLGFPARTEKLPQCRIAVRHFVCGCVQKILKSRHPPSIDNSNAIGNDPIR